VKPVVVLRHEGRDRLAVGAAEIEAAGLRIEYIDTPSTLVLPQPAEVGGIVVLGGSMGVSDVGDSPFLNRELEFIRQAWSQSVPTLGICLGAQLLAAALGGTVRRASQSSLGFLPVIKTPQGEEDPIFSNWCRSDRVLRWHRDTFTLPGGSELLMRADDIHNQAFRAGPCAWGVQFHIEPDRALLEDWISSASELGTERPERLGSLLDGADEHLAHHQGHAQKSFAAFAQIVVNRSLA
jgi:GMP synthase (glutamine-hydrolysing)